MAKYNLNEKSLATINNESEAYVLGYLYANGSVYRGEDNNRYELTISGTDEELLYNIKEVIGAEHPVKQRGNSYNIRIVNKKFVESLESKGLTTYKSDTLEYPNDIPEEFVIPFIRGYFDGKGTFQIEKERRIISTLSGGSLRFIEGLRDNLVALGLSHAKVHQYGARESTNIIRYYVYDTRRLFGLLYSDARIYSRVQRDRYLSGIK